MGGAFNPQILVEKLAKLNSSQTSIETLSHWCIFHMNKAKPVVETWDRQFHCAPREQRLAYLYLANDILQNSRRKGAEFVGEFWRVLPDALRDVMENGDEFARNAAQRLVNIWDERKVFGSRGQVLKEEIVGRHLETNNRDGKQSGHKLRLSAGTALDKIVSDYQVLYGGQLDEDTVSNKCRNAVSAVDKMDKEISGDINSAKLSGSRIVEELQGQHAILRDCIEQLNAVESSRASLVSHLREALQEEEFKLDQVRLQIQAAQSQTKQADNLCRQLLSNSHMVVAEQSLKDNPISAGPHSFMSGTREQSAPVMYTRQLPFSDKPGEDTKATAAAVAAKLTASTSSAQMLTYVLNSLASGVMGTPSAKENSDDFPAEKRPKLEHNNPHPPPPPYPTTTRDGTPDEQPPPPSSPPPLPPLPPPMQQYPVPQYMQTAGTMNGPYGYLPNQQPPLPMPSYTPLAPSNSNNNAPQYMAPPPSSNYQSFQGAEGSFYSQQSSLPMAPMPRQ